MKRIDTATAEADTFGTGRDGFTNGNPGMAIPPTQLDDSFFNNAQEELCRVAEGDGSTLDEDNFHQVEDAVQRAAVRGSCALATADYILNGLTFTLNGASLSIPLAAGEFVENARRYVITAAKLTAAGFDTHTLPASRDTYFYIASDDPGAPSTPPNRETVWVEQADVANGASAPSTPAGTLLFAMVVSNGSGSTAVTYYNRGPRLQAENGCAIIMRPTTVGGTAGALVPTGSNALDLGERITESVAGFISNAHVQGLDLQTTASALYTFLRNRRYTELATTTGGGTTNVNILAATDYPDGTVALVTIEGVALDPSDPTDGYTFKIECHIHQDGGSTWDLDGTGGTPLHAEGAGALAAGVDVDFTVSGANLRLTLTGHGTDALRWAFEIHYIILGD